MCMINSPSANRMRRRGDHVRRVRRVPCGRPEFDFEARGGRLFLLVVGVGRLAATGGVDLAALIVHLSALATESSRHRGKKERATQRKSFRDILGTVESGEVPEESLKIEKSRHTFSGWAQVKQLTAVRDVLAKGLNTHFVHNETLAEIFDLLIESGDGVDDPRRKAASRAQSQAKALENFQHRQKQRKKKHALTNPHADDE